MSRNWYLPANPNYLNANLTATPQTHWSCLHFPWKCIAYFLDILCIEKSKFIEQPKIQQKEHETRLDTIEDVNEKLIGDIKTFNDRMLESLPKAIIKENEELKETLNMLHTVIDIYKQAEIDAEEESENCAEGNDDLNELTKQNFFQCKDCSFMSESKRGLSVYIARKRYQGQGQEDFNLIYIW